MMSKEKFDPAAVARLAGEIQASLDAELTPEERLAMRHRGGDDRMPAIVYAADECEQAMTDFAIDALGTMADEIQAFVDRRMEALYRQALDVYYAAEELSRDPEHASLLPHVEAMRRAHEEQYGRPIPPRPAPRQRAGNGSPGK